MTATTTRTVAAIDAEVAKIEAERVALATRMTALRRERKVAVRAEAEARTRELGAALLALDGTEDQVAAEAARLIAVAKSKAPAAKPAPKPVVESVAQQSTEQRSAVA